MVSALHFTETKMKLSGVGVHCLLEALGQKLLPCSLRLLADVDLMSLFLLAVTWDHP